MFIYFIYSSMCLLIPQFLIYFPISPLVIIMFVFYNTLIFKNYFKNCDKGASLVVQMVKNPPAMQETQVDLWVQYHMVI